MCNLKAGDHIVVERGPITHHGIYIGEGRVVHYSGPRLKCKVSEVSLEKFCDGNDFWIYDYDDVFNQMGLMWSSSQLEYYDSKRRFSPDFIVARAVSQIGEEWYSLIGNNCEHFAHWCTLGDSCSGQVGLLSLLTVGVSDTLGRWFGLDSLSYEEMRKILRKRERMARQEYEKRSLD